MGGVGAIDEVILGTALHGAGGDLRIAVVGEQHDRHLGVTAPEIAQHFQTPLVAKRKINQHQIKEFPLQPRQRIRRGGRNPELEQSLFGLLQHLADEAVGRSFFYQQNFRTRIYFHVSVQPGVETVNTEIFRIRASKITVWGKRSNGDWCPVAKGRGDCAVMETIAATLYGSTRWSAAMESNPAMLMMKLMCRKHPFLLLALSLTGLLVGCYESLGPEEIAPDRLITTSVEDFLAAVEQQGSTDFFVSVRDASAPVLNQKELLRHPEAAYWCMLLPAYSVDRPSRSFLAGPSRASEAAVATVAEIMREQGARYVMPVPGMALIDAELPESRSERRDLLRALANHPNLEYVESSCMEPPALPEPEPFRVMVRSPDGSPVEGATIVGGIDFDHYLLQTDSTGSVTLPGSARGEKATIARTNFLPARVEQIGPGDYTLTPADRRLRLLGATPGRPLRFGGGELITLESLGGYHRYRYDDGSVVEVASSQLLDASMSIWDARLYGDTLWMSTHGDGIHVFSLADPSSPRPLFQLPVSGPAGRFVKHDGVLVVGDRPDGQGPLRILAYSPSGEVRELARFRERFDSSDREVGRHGDRRRGKEVSSLRRSRGKEPALRPGHLQSRIPPSAVRRAHEESRNRECCTIGGWSSRRPCCRRWTAPSSTPSSICPARVAAAGRSRSCFRLLDQRVPFRHAGRWSLLSCTTSSEMW